jgi:hypothetical protein
MRLDPRRVRFVAPMFHVGVFGGAVRFVGKENTVHLQETALVAEGNLLKVGLLGLEILFRRALAEWSAVTIPYSRITAARYVRFPLLRVIALIVLAVCLVVPAVVASLSEWAAGLALGIAAVIPAFLALYVTFRVSARYVIRFRTRNGRKTKIMFRITSAKLRAEFDRRLGENRAAAARYADPGGAADVPDPIAAPRPPVWPKVVFLSAAFVLTMGMLAGAGLAMYGALAGGPGDLGFGGSDEVNTFSAVGPRPRPASAPVADVTPETIATGLVGHQFAFQGASGERGQVWTIESGEVRAVEIVGSELLPGGTIRRVDVRVTLEGGGQRLRGVLTLLYTRAAGGWTLSLVAAKAAGDGKTRPFELTNLK